ncbi:MAG: RBBP9/YdeN family alpha/beta hydrolase [Lacibacter sp.]
MKYLIVPGLYNSGPGHWQTNWERKYPNSFHRVEQTNWNEPIKQDWVNRLHTQITAAENEPLILVAHSLGCITVVHWAMHYCAAHVKAIMLVAPADVEKSTKKELRDFAPIPLQSLPVNSVVVASSNDPYAAMDRTKIWAAAWGSTHINAGAVGHINSDSALGNWEEGLRLLQSLHTKA